MGPQDTRYPAERRADEFGQLLVAETQNSVVRCRDPARTMPVDRHVGRPALERVGRPRIRLQCLGERRMESQPVRDGQK